MLWFFFLLREGEINRMLLFCRRRFPSYPLPAWLVSSPPPATARHKLSKESFDFPGSISLVSSSYKFNASLFRGETRLALHFSVKLGAQGFRPWLGSAGSSGWSSCRTVMSEPTRLELPHPWWQLARNSLVVVQRRLKDNKEDNG